MAKYINPWNHPDDDDDNNSDKPWIGNMIINSPKPKLKKILKAPQKPDFEFKWWWSLVIIALIWLGSGFYSVQPNEEGIVLRFGAYVDTTTPGLHYHLPFPIEQVYKVNITQERSINLGVSTAKGPANTFTESHMLTGDENIVDVNLTIVWRIENVKDYVFNMQNPDQTVNVAAQSVLREIVGQSEMLPIISGDRGKVEDETKEELQNVLDEFGSGIKIVRVKLQKADPPKQVVDAFNEVQRAKADMERFKNEAEAYRNEILPKSRGEAEQRLQNAQAYKQAIVAKAQGEAERFANVYAAYKQGREVTTKRMYLEAMEAVLQNSDKIILPDKAASSVIPYLPLDRLHSSATASQPNKGEK